MSMQAGLLHEQRKQRSEKKRPDDVHGKGTIRKHRSKIPVSPLRYEISGNAAGAAPYSNEEDVDNIHEETG